MRRFLEVPLLALSAGSVTLASAGPRDTLTFHRDAARTGWSAVESELTRSAVTGPGFGQIWESAPFDAVEGEPPRLYASPLYVDELLLTDGEFRGRRLPAVIAATNHGDVYAIHASNTEGVPAGTILWRANLGGPCRLAPQPLDGVLTGVLATPVIDPVKGRLYVTSCEETDRWRAHALDLGSGNPVAGWPVALSESAFAAPGIGRNVAAGGIDWATRADHVVQRGALNLSPDGSRLYVTFGESVTGWIVAVDTGAARIASAFATVAVPYRHSGGVWGVGGVAVDPQGFVYAATGTGFSGNAAPPGDWVQSVLKLADSPSGGLTLHGTYTPFNHCATATMDIDLGSGGVLLLPTQQDASTPLLLAVGGKQGNAYLVNRERMPGPLDRRLPCSEDSASDGSLLPPEGQPQFGRRGPLNVFGPYTEKDAALDMARGRTVPAYFRDGEGRSHLLVAGNTKRADGTSTSIAPSIARLAIVSDFGHPSYLRVERTEPTLVFENPGSPVVTSNGTDDAIVWVLDQNARRSAPLTGSNPPRPVLYALDALTLDLLWNSRAGELHTGGKYNEPAFARGMVFVGTDRIQAFGVKDGSPDGKRIYAERCAACHENPGGRIPPRELIALRSQAAIVAALTDGVMREQAAGLSEAEVEAVARYLQ